MKNLAHVVLVLIILIACVTVVTAQNRIHNPQLPNGLVFQWKIITNEAHSSWDNENFTVSRGNEGLVIYYGTYFTLADALEGMPILPESTPKSNVSLIPFFNQTSISAADAFALAGDKNWMDISGEVEQDAVSFTVYFETYESPISFHSVSNIDQELSFEIQSNHTFAYSAGTFASLEDAENYQTKLQSIGYPMAEVNKFLNGQKVAMTELHEIFAFADWVE